MLTLVIHAAADDGDSRLALKKRRIERQTFDKVGQKFGTQKSSGDGPLPGSDAWAALITT